MRCARVLPVILLLVSFAFAADQKPPKPKPHQPFTFIVFGDSRLPGYLPYRDDASVRRFFRAVIDYAYGPEVPFEAKTVYDPASGELVQVTLDVPGHPEKSATFLLRNGWPETIKVGPDETVILRGEGQRWVFDQVVTALAAGAVPGEKRGARFALHTGDITYSGYSGNGEDNPYWRDFYSNFLSRLPAGGAAPLAARFYPAPGNHETWLDPGLEGFRREFPQLAPLGFSAEQRLYQFDYEGSRFLFLDTGDLDARRPSAWLSQHPDHAGQMQWLRAALSDARAAGLRNVFVTFHNPAFCVAGAGPIPPDQNPHALLREFARDLRITVFNGHVHTTEAFEVDGIRYLVLGNGGGEQTLNAPAPRTDYPAELYWRGAPRIEEYNYLEVSVSDKDSLTLRLHRFRPGAAKQFETVELFR